MPTPKKGPRLGGSAAHQRHMLANLATALFEHGRITTTEARARTLRPVAEKLITKAMKGDLHNRREVLKTIRDKTVVHVLFTEIGPRMAERPGRLHADHQDRSPQGRQRPDGGDRAGDRGLLAGSQEDRRPRRRPPRRAAEPKAEDGRRGDRGSTRREETTTVAESGRHRGPGFADLEFGDDVAEALEDGAAPSEEFTIKGNKDSGKYHTPDSQWYDQTIAEVWFRTEEAAENAGFVKAG